MGQYDPEIRSTYQPFPMARKLPKIPFYTQIEKNYIFHDMIENLNLLNSLFTSRFGKNLILKEKHCKQKWKKIYTCI